jgi:hypothetical protein
MKNIKDITISIFAIIGFVAILTSFNNQTEPQVTHGTPESHVWELTAVGTQAGFLWNKETGELKALDWKTAWNGLKVYKPELGR